MSEVVQDQKDQQDQRKRRQAYGPLLQQLRLWSGLILWYLVPDLDLAG